MMTIKSLLYSVMLFAAPLWNGQASAETCLKTCQVSEAGYTLIRTFEGYSPFIYKDAVGLPTIGFGHLIKPGETFKQPLMGAEADALLKSDTVGFQKAINRMVQVRLWQHHFDALASFTFNLGSGALQKSTLLKRVNQQRHAEVPAEFMKWVNAGGRVLRGLVIRRKAEAALYAGN
jgi:lysozyme